MDDLRRRFPEFRVPSSHDEARRGMQRIVSDLADQLLPHAAARIGLTHEGLRERLLGARLEESHEVNGYVRWSEGGQRFEIVLNLALMMFFHKMVKLLVGTIGFGEDEERATEVPIGRDTLVAACKGLIEAFWAGRLLTQAGLWYEQFGKMQILLTEHLVHCCECSVVGHELGHVVIQLSPGEVEEVRLARQMVDGYTALVSGLEGEAKNEMARAWVEEICADLIGLHLCLAQPKTQPLYSHWRNHKQMLFGGAEIALILRAMLEEYHWKVHCGNPRIRVSPVSTHPPGLLRLAAIRASKERPAFSETDLLYRDFGGRCAVFAKDILNAV